MTYLIDLLKQEKELLDKKFELVKLYPDIEEVYFGRGSKKVLASSAINLIANKVHFCHSCGCCNDAVLYASPYIKVGDIIIYSNPFKITIGEKIPDSLDHKIYEGWEADFEGFNPEIIKVINESEYLRSSEQREEYNSIEDIY